MRTRKYSITILLCFISLAVFADSGIYICGHFRRDRVNTVPALKASGYTFGILFNVHVTKNGDLITDGETICKDGKYVFGETSPFYVDDVNSLITGETSIQRLEHCIGGWENDAYKNITNLIRSEGTGTNSILYRNFKALKDAIPSVIAINNDIEQDYEAETQADFHIMLYDIGFKTTIAPYMNKSYWDKLVSKINTARPGAVDRNYLQCYGGGGGNNPKDWNIDNLPIYGSRDIEANSYTHQQIVTTMTNWKNDTGIVGGFYWNYNASRNLKAEAAPINEVFGGGKITYHDQIVAMIYPVKEYKAPQTDFSIGKYSYIQIKEKGFDPSQLAALKLKEGTKIILYTGTDNTGEAFSSNIDVADIRELIGDKTINSWTIIADRIEELDGKEFFIKNKQSGFFLKPSRNSTASGLVIQQKEADESNYMAWEFKAVDNGLYKITNKGSDKVLQMRRSNIYTGGLFEQNAYTEKEYQHFIVKYDETLEAYKLIPLNSLKYAGVADQGQGKVNSMIIQRESAPSTDWLLIPASMSSIKNEGAEGQIKVYPTVVTDKVYIESRDLQISNIKIIDINGNLMLEAYNVEKEINVSSLQAGSYVLNIDTEGKKMTFKMIKQ